MLNDSPKVTEPVTTDQASCLSRWGLSSSYSAVLAVQTESLKKWTLFLLDYNFKIILKLFKQYILW